HVLSSVAEAKAAQEKNATKNSSEAAAKSPEGGKASRPIYDDWSDDDVLRLLAARVADYPHEPQEIIAGRFFARGDRRLGFYTLLLSAAKTSWRYDESLLVDGQRVAMNPLTDEPGSPLAHYIARQSWLNAAGNDASKKPPRSMDSQHGPQRESFVGFLAELRDA